MGALRGIEPEALRLCWDAVTFETPMEGSVLEVESMPWTITCGSCGRTWTSPVPFVSCACGDEGPIPSGGDELDLMAITVDEEATVP